LRLTTSILGLGHHLPPEVDRGGVRRPIAVEPIGPSTLAVPAAHSALSRAGYAAADADFIVFATMTPDVTFPGAGCYFQDQMGCGTIGALDLRAQCAGFIFALVVADRFIRAHTYRCVIVAAAEVHSSGLDYSKDGIEVARLYGDGAGVAVLGPDGRGALRAAVIHTDGRDHQQFWCEYPSSRQHPVRMTIENFEQKLHFPRIDFDAVRRFGETSIDSAVREVLQAAGMGLRDVDCLIIGHVFPSVAEAVGERLGVTGSRLCIPALRHGHLTAAALPVALSEEVAAGRLGPGATVCLAASGAGLCWGAVLVTL
jgi:3-oxoacyl-[acyl-carrier-protein] synthase-3